MFLSVSLWTLRYAAPGGGRPAAGGGPAEGPFTVSHLQNTRTGTSTSGSPPSDPSDITLPPSSSSVSPLKGHPVLDGANVQRRRKSDVWENEAFDVAKTRPLLAALTCRHAPNPPPPPPPSLNHLLAAAWTRAGAAGAIQVAKKNRKKNRSGPDTHTCYENKQTNKNVLALILLFPPPPHRRPPAARPNLLCLNRFLFRRG